MKQETKKIIVKAVNDWIDEKNPQRSGNKLAQKIGVSNATISKIRRKNLDGISDDILNQLAGFFNVRDEDHSWDHFETPNYKAVIAVLNNAKTFQRRAAIDGDSGWGKSYAIKAFCRANGNEEAVHIICRRSMNPRKFVQHIADKLGITKYSGNRYDMEEVISRRLLSMNYPVLIFDELENLSDSCFSSIKTIIDLTDRRCAVVLSGIDIQEEIKEKAKRGRDAFNQISRRFPDNSYEFLDPIEFDGVMAICNQLGINNKAAQEWIFENVRDYDALENLIRDAIRVARKNERKIDRMFLEHVFGSKQRRRAA